MNPLDKRGLELQYILRFYFSKDTKSPYPGFFRIPKADNKKKRWGEGGAVRWGEWRVVVGWIGAAGAGLAGVDSLHEMKGFRENAKDGLKHSEQHKTQIYCLIIHSIDGINSSGSHRYCAYRSGCGNVPWL
jgi:hypothetical protein